jgi:transposase InsO family protein
MVQIDTDAVRSRDRSFRFYNQERPHQALAYRTPAQVYALVQSHYSAPRWTE